MKKRSSCFFLLGGFVLKPETVVCSPSAKDNEMSDLSFSL